MSLSEHEIQQQLTAVLRDVFDDETLNASPELTARDVDGWDSINNVRLMMSVERTFRIKFAASELTSLKNVGDLVRLVKGKTD